MSFRPRQLLALFAIGGCASCVLAQDVPGDDGGPLVVGANREKWTGLDLQRIDAAFEFLGRHRSDTLKQPGQPDITDTETLLREIVEVSGEAYIGHKNLLDLTGKVRFGVEDRFLDSDSFGADDHASDFTNLFDVNGHVLGASRVPLDLYTRREEQFLDRDFGSSVTSTTFESGVLANIQSERAPTTLRAFHLESSQDDPLGQSNYGLNQNSFNAHSNIRVREGNRLEADYAFDDIGEHQASFRNDYQRHHLQLTDVQNFGEKGQHELRSYFRFYDQNGRFQQRMLRLDEQLLLAHTDRLETRYNLSWDRQSRFDGDQDTLQGSATIKHKLFDSLTSTGTIGARRFGDETDFTSNEWFTSGTLDYTKKVARGRLDLGLGASYNAQDNSERGSPISVLDESHIATDPAPITLSRRNVVVGSVVVTGPAGFPTYQEGIDYIVDYFPDRVEIRPILGGAITTGSAVLVDYDLGPEPANEIDTVGWSTSGRYTLSEGVLRGLSAYTSYRRLDHSVDAPTAIVLDDTWTWTYGLEYRRGGLHLRTEREEHGSTLNPYDTTRFSAAYDFEAVRNGTAGLEASHEILDFGNPDNHVVFTRLTARWNQKLSESFDVLLRVDFRDEQDDLRGDSQGIDQAATLQWHKRQTSAYVTVRNTWLDATFSERRSEFLEIGLRREF